MVWLQRARHGDAGGLCADQALCCRARHCFVLLVRVPLTRVPPPNPVYRTAGATTQYVELDADDGLSYEEAQQRLEVRACCGAAPSSLHAGMPAGVSMHVCIHGKICMHVVHAG